VVTIEFYNERAQRPLYDEPKAFREGFEAFLDPDNYDDWTQVPYYEGDYRRDEWLEGWYIAEDWSIDG
jgi:hypothetical protein